MDVALTSAMRSNLLTLQSTQAGIDKVQGVLASGRKVNSALDNPSSFFAAQSLNNRASDLGRLLDSMGQNISTIKQADKGVSSLTKLVEQADAIANQAATAASGAGQQASVAGSVKLTGLQDVTKLAGIVNGEFSLTFDATDESGNQIDFDSSTSGVVDSKTISVGGTSGNATVDQMIAEINAITYGPNSSQAFEAKLSDEGKLEIKSLTGGDMRITLDNGANNAVGSAANRAEDINLATALGFGDRARSLDTGALEGGTTAIKEVTLTATAKPVLMSTSFRTGTNGTEIANASESLANLRDANGDAIFTATGDGSGNLMIGVNGNDAKAVAAFTVAANAVTAAGTSTIQGLVDTINTSAELKDSVRASYDATTGQFSIQAISSDVKTIQMGLAATGSSLTSNNLGFGMDDLSAVAGSADYSNFTVTPAAGELARLEKDYNSIRTQIDELVQDSGYAGVNLLKGDDLKTTFNADRTSSLTTKGVSFNSEGLGLGKANFSSAQTIDSALTQLRAAKTEVRNFGTTLANDLSIIQTRQDFTKETINNLQEGSDKLTLADKNEEGAKLLALQTQQQLGVISLSMASQSAQSVLRLF
jgi:flagellin-like hook-associated protein FlgL